MAAVAVWPLQSYLELGVLPTAVPCARGHAQLVLAEWGLQELADPAELVVSELVTNGIRASRGLVGSRFGGRWSAGMPPVRLCAIRLPNRAPAGLGRQQPDAGAAGTDNESEGGRGLWLVEALSEDWGAFQPEHASGKVVWAAVVKP